MKKKYTIFQKNKNKLLLLLFKNQTFWKIYIFKIVYIKITKNMSNIFFKNDIFLEYILKKISFIKIIKFQNSYLKNI